MTDEELKKNVKGCLSITGEYSQEEINEAILMNDTEKLNEMSARCNVLCSAYNTFVTEIDSGDEDRRNIAISSFKRPTV